MSYELPDTRRQFFADAKKVELERLRVVGRDSVG